MKGSKIAGRYATALLELSIEQNKIEPVLADMKYLLEVNNETRDFQLLLDSPIVKGDKKIAIFGELFGQFEEISTSFVNLITKNGRESYLPSIAEAFDAQVKEHKGIVPITIISATSLENSTRAIILEKVEKSIKGQLEVTELIDESLIGGFIVRMGDKQIDASVASQFNDLKQRLTR
jgi:F-type H+-transporting ATPase subunit delta